MPHELTRPPRLRDVAGRAGVSVTTVSRFLNGQIRLPDTTSARIAEALRVLEYQPNLHARRLSTGRSDTIGLVVPDIANPFFARLAAAVEMEADARGLQLALFATLNRPGRERTYVEALSRNHVDGLIFATNHANHGDLHDLINATGRVVVVDEQVSGAEAPRLFCDNAEGGRKAGAYLAELGHRSVAYLGAGPEMLSGRRRIAGLREGLGAVGGVEVRLFQCDYTRVGGARAADAFLAAGRPATAIFAAADEVAIGVLQVLREAGVSVPGDISVIGFDDVAPLHLFDPPLTAVRQPIEEMGRRAVEILTSPAEHPDRSNETLLEVDLIVRASCAPVPASRTKA